MLGKIRELLVIALLAMSLWILVHTFGLPKGLIPRFRETLKDLSGYFDRWLAPLDENSKP
jgi:hypothetical protein